MIPSILFGYAATHRWAGFFLMVLLAIGTVILSAILCYLILDTIDVAKSRFAIWRQARRNAHPEIPRCRYCQTRLKDAGSGLGLYCPRKNCVQSIQEPW